MKFGGASIVLTFHHTFTTHAYLGERIQLPITLAFWAGCCVKVLALMANGDKSFLEPEALGANAAM